MGLAQVTLAGESAAFGYAGAAQVAIVAAQRDPVRPKMGEEKGQRALNHLSDKSLAFMIDIHKIADDEFR